ncbi:MAG: hypothetical protein IIX60_01265, partial [Clostridia bacterium]|nr:hypothetical protein [Clostridia bacterium]
MKQKQTDYTVCYTGEKKLKRDYRQFFGFLEFFEAGKSDYRKEHDNFFYVDLDTIAKETGISRRSIADRTGRRPADRRASRPCAALYRHERSLLYGDPS